MSKFMQIYFFIPSFFNKEIKFFLSSHFSIPPIKQTLMLDLDINDISI